MYIEGSDILRVMSIELYWSEKHELRQIDFRTRLLTIVNGCVIAKSSHR